MSLDLPVRVEWSEGKGQDWDLWCFDKDADIDDGDVFLFEDPDLTLAVVVARATPFTTLRSKKFHHWEIIAEEHELTVAELKTQAGL